MKRHYRGVWSGDGNFNKATARDLKVHNLVVDNISYTQTQSSDLEREVADLKQQIADLKQIIANMKISDLKDVDCGGLDDGASLGWDSEFKKWVIFQEAAT